jgi:plastocyanin
VRLGDRSGNDIIALSGVQIGDAVVAAGSFTVRAERDRLGLRSSESSTSTGTSAPPPQVAPAASAVPKETKVLVTEKGYEPEKLTVRAGQPVRITFIRTTDKTCGTEVVFPSLNIRRPLPLNEAVAIEFTPKTAGEIGFVCGRNMLRGTVVVQ